MSEEYSTEPKDLYRFELSEEQGAEVEKLTGQAAKSIIISVDELKDMTSREGRYEGSLAAGNDSAS